MLDGLKAILPIYAGPLEVESDCATLVNELKDVTQSKSTIAGTVRDVKNILMSMSDVLILKINRMGNKVAHKLARIGYSELCGRVLIGSALSHAMDLIKTDCSI
jgi:hypothetical protein